MFAELYDPRTQSWSFTGRMRRFRYQHAAVLLSNGKVLVVGGQTVGAVTPTAELFDPVSDSWADAGSMAAERAGSGAVPLADGKVLVVGGFVLDPYAPRRIPASTAEIYDPQTDRWSPAAPMHDARFGHTVTLLLDGRVLVTGGHGDADNLASAEIYDPRANSWSLAGLLSTPRDGHTATLLHNGKILVVGGFSSESSRAPLATAELFDPLANSWSPAASLAIARSEHAATLLEDGRVLVAGGSGQAGPLASVEVYDPAATPSKPPVTAPGVPGTTVVLATIASMLALLLMISFGFRRLHR
jgi:N-acetylneuraminic acid mutarotase